MADNLNFGSQAGVLVKMQVKRNLVPAKKCLFKLYLKPAPQPLGMQLLFNED